jgi:hypothetical protein
MNQLLTHPPYQPLPPYQVRLHDILEYSNNKYTIKVFAGYRSDGGSMPRIVWSLLGVTPFDPRCVYAFILHDFLYQCHLVQRKEADQVLDEVLAIEPACSRLQRWLIYVHVRMWGWIPYWSKPDESVEAGRWHGKIEYKAQA